MKNLSIALMMAGFLMVGCECPECPPEKECEECPECPVVQDEVTATNPSIVDGKDTTAFMSTTSQTASFASKKMDCGTLSKFYEDAFKQRSTLTIDFTPCTNGQVQFIVFDKPGNWVSSKTLRSAGTTTLSLPSEGKVYVLCAAGQGECDVQITQVAFP